MQPSGKARDFDSLIRGFQSSHLRQPERAQARRESHQTCNMTRRGPYEPAAQLARAILYVAGSSPARFTKGPWCIMPGFPQSTQNGDVPDRLSKPGRAAMRGLGEQGCGNVQGTGVHTRECGREVIEGLAPHMKRCRRGNGPGCCPGASGNAAVVRVHHASPYGSAAQLEERPSVKRERAGSIPA